MTAAEELPGSLQPQPHHAQGKISHSGISPHFDFWWNFNRTVPAPGCNTVPSNLVSDSCATCLVGGQKVPHVYIEPNVC